MRALRSITPAAAARLGSVREFWPQVERAGRELAKLNVPRRDSEIALAQFDALLAEVNGSGFGPAREQLRLATAMVLNAAYYRVGREESRAFFGLYAAEVESPDLDETLRRFARLLAKTFGARVARAGPAGAPGSPVHPLCFERGRPAERLLAQAWRGRYASYWIYPVEPGMAFHFGFAASCPLLPRDAALLEAAAERCRRAIDRAHLQAEVRRLHAAARNAEEEERRRIGRELHDEAGQSLLFLRLQLEMMEREAPGPLAPRLREAREVAGKVVSELRRIVSALSPAVVERLGLCPALRQMAARFEKLHPAAVRLRIPALPARLPRQHEEVVYRIAQECLNNVARHSGATRVNISLRLADSKVRLRVTDNGAGFTAEQVRTKSMSFGLAGMRERAALVGGALTVRSAPGKGVTVIFDLPLLSAPVARNVKNPSTSD
jgi:signal transduction histidine kinase